jgi:hypothetical protein
VLEHQPVRVAPVVEDLAALDVPADAPRVPVPALAQVLPRGSHLVQVGELVGRVQVPGLRLQRHRQGVVVGRHAAQIAANERHHRPTLALPVQIQEITDDHAQGVQVPV